MATNCVCESNQIDVYDIGYDNRYLYDVFTLTKFDVSNTGYLGMTIINSGSSNGYFTKLGSLIQQSDTIISGKTNWASVFERPVILENNIYDKGTYVINTNLANYIDTTDFTITSYPGGIAADSGDNVYYHKKVGNINYLYIKGVFLVDEASSTKALKINLPYEILDKFKRYWNRVPYRVSVIVNGTVRIASMIGSQLKIEAPTNGWYYQTGYTNTIDINITYPSGTTAS